MGHARAGPELLQKLIEMLDMPSQAAFAQTCRAAFWCCPGLAIRTLQVSEGLD